MRIGELSGRTGISTRMLRYDEIHGLLRSARGSNGYRRYVEADVARASTVGFLIQSGLSTRLIAMVLSQDRIEWTAECDRSFAEILRRELELLEKKITHLSRSRQAVLDAMPSARG